MAEEKKANYLRVKMGMKKKIPSGYILPGEGPDLYCMLYFEIFRKQLR